MPCPAHFLPSEISRVNCCLMLILSPTAIEAGTCRGTLWTCSVSHLGYSPGYCSAILSSLLCRRRVVVLVEQVPVVVPRVLHPILHQLTTHLTATTSLRSPPSRSFARTLVPEARFTWSAAALEVPRPVSREHSFVSACRPSDMDAAALGFVASVGVSMRCQNGISSMCTKVVLFMHHTLYVHQYYRPWYVFLT